MSARRLVVLPGMGATSAMYRGPWRALESALFPDWPEYRGERTLGEVAERIVSDSGLTARDVPLGSSLGGMVALEIAARLRAPVVGLIGSAKSAEEVSPWLRLAAPLASITPGRFAQTLAGVSKPELAKQFASSDPDFVRAMCRAVTEWEAPAYEGRILRVHGEDDRVIPCPSDALGIEGAGHLVAWTHAEEAVRALRERLAEAETA